MRPKKPKDWKEQSRAAYEEAGRSIGRMLMHNPHKEQQVWDLIGGTKIWPRWYLSAFRSMYIAENPTEYQTWKHKRWRHRKKARRESKRLLEQRQKAVKAISEPEVIDC